MTAEEKLKKKLDRIHRWIGYCDRMVQKESGPMEEVFRRTVAEIEARKQQLIEEISAREMRIQGELDQAGKEYARKKYQSERDTSVNKSDIHCLGEEIQDIQKKYSQELTHLNEEKTNIKISHDRQLSALKDLYQEKQRSLTVARSGLLRQWRTITDKLIETKSKADQLTNELKQEASEKISRLMDQAEAKHQGWATALETMNREKEALTQEKEHLEKRLTEIRGEKEKEIEAARLAMTIAREQLEVDKATLIEKAEEEQRRCEAEVSDLKHKIEVAERELQDFVVQSDQRKKDAEDAFLREEGMIKESLRSESEKRDYDQKLYEQEKSQKEKEINRLREEYEKKKWHWDNQIKSLLMQKSVQDSEQEAVRIRVDREARTVLRGLEAKRDELRQRLSDVKTRHKVLSENAQKENDLITQRWHWRRDRLWSLWQNRLEVLRKERGVLQEQIEAVTTRFEQEKKQVSQSDSQETKRIDNLQNFLLQSTEQNRGQLKQREIQFELEKTRLFTQIKECETLMDEWTSRIKETQEEVRKNNTGLVEQMNYLDKWYREEETETQLFLQSLQGSLTTLEEILSQNVARRADAA